MRVSIIISIHETKYTIPQILLILCGYADLCFNLTVQFIETIK